MTAFDCGIRIAMFVLLMVCNPTLAIDYHPVVGGVRKKIDHFHIDPHHHRQSSHSHRSVNPNLSSVIPSSSMIKASVADKLQTANSNVYYIEDELHDDVPAAIDYGHHTSIPQETYLITSEKKGSKFFSEEISFVAAIVTLAVFLCFLSSIFIPLAVFFFTSGGLLPFGGLNNAMQMNGAFQPANLGSFMVGRKRRKRSLIPSSIYDYNQNNLLDIFSSKLESAVQKFQ
ncbi:Peroxidase [Sarcoptes scabiei]|nr:Peroxidase [Sarcoptes scabiei]